MDNPFVLAALISFCYLIIKFGEMRIIDKENKPLKVIIKDMFLVYFACVIGIFFLQQVVDSELNIFTDIKKPSTVVFTNSPEF
tara:strand:+ start:29779 stop:30027 length:249 start_codon:yes stop_codon:yes gene_type:complete